MGSYRSAESRAGDVAVLTAADRPAGVDAVDEHGRPTWLAEGESITYWVRLPYGAARRIAAAAAQTIVGPDGGLIGTYDVGTASLAKFIEGVVDWTMSDEDGAPVAWDPWHAAALLDGLPGEVVRELAERIGHDAAPETPAPVEVA